MEGRPIRIRLLPSLRAHRGTLLSGEPLGAAVHAGTFLRKRRIVLDTELLETPREFARILVHELFHFAWLRLGNRTRRAYETLVDAEMRRHARGELGWSAEFRKRALTPGDRINRTRKWREYICESFCDSGAWLFAGVGRHREFTLSGAFRRKRRRWFRESGMAQRISI